VAPGPTTTTTTLPRLVGCDPATPNACDDGDPCTIDTCRPETGCGYRAVEGFAAVTCLLHEPPGCAPVPAAVAKRLARARALVTRAEETPRKAKVFLRKAVKLVKEARRIVDRRARRHTMSTPCAAAFKRLLRDAQVRAQLLARGFR
jgi:hypothetical protein